MTGRDSCYRCRKPLGEFPTGILLMYPGRDRTEAPLYTLPCMYCRACIESFYEWSKPPKETAMERKLRLLRENSEYESFKEMRE